MRYIPLDQELTNEQIEALEEVIAPLEEEIEESMRFWEYGKLRDRFAVRSL